MFKTIKFTAVLAALAFCATAHEIGTSRVTALFNGDRYTIDLATDAQALAEKLAIVTGSAPGLQIPAAQLQDLIASRDQAFRHRIKIAFDGVEVTPEIRYSITPADQPGQVPGANIQLAGTIPAGARNFTWSFGWTFASYALTVRNAGSPNASTQWLEGGDHSAPFPLTIETPAESRLSTARRYLVLGFTHIVPEGLDHMLFVLGIYLLSRRAKTVLWQVSAFTVAHSITLGLSMYGLISVPSRIVEPAIAISIAYVAIENIFLSELKSWRVALVFAFGLLHGMGFAGALKEIGLARSEFLTALLTFNLGVEAGQLAVIGAAFLLIGWRYSDKAWYRGRIVIPASLMIACTALYWTVERLHA
jgi:hydrogenase/urease accessory protein HupE